MKLITSSPDYEQWDQVADLIRTSFAYMEPILGHPAKAASVTAAELRMACTAGPAFLVIEDSKPVACLFCRQSRDIPKALYLGRLAVADHKRGCGLARQLIDAAKMAARNTGHNALTLDTAKALIGLHSTFRRLGFDLTPPLDQTPGDIVTMIRPLSDPKAD